MPFGLGFFATAGVSAAGGSYELITSTILTSSQSSVTFSNLGDYSSTYQHLQLRMVSKQTAGGLDTSYMRMNGISSNSYSWHFLRGTGSGVQSGASSTTSSMFIAYSGEVTNGFGAAVIDILDPYESKYKTVRSFTGAFDPGGQLVGLLSGLYQSTDSLTSISIHAGTGNLAQYSRFSLYGIRGV